MKYLGWGVTFVRPSQRPCSPHCFYTLLVRKTNQQQQQKKKPGSSYSQVFDQYVSHSGSTLQNTCFHGLALPINGWTWSSAYLGMLLALSFKDQLRIIGHTFLHENLRVYPGSLRMTGWKSHYAYRSMHTMRTHHAYQSLVASLWGAGENS